MTLEEIGFAQPYDIDHPDQEATTLIASSIISELTIVYDLLSQNNTNDLEPHLEAIQVSVDAAVALGMNYTMFQADLDFIETLN